jgi:hypothetical protein
VRGPSIIGRRENQRQITVRTNIRDRDQGGFVSEAQNEVSASVAMPPGYRITWGGQFENLARARTRLALILPVTVLIVFGLLLVAFCVRSRRGPCACQCPVFARRRDPGALRARHSPVRISSGGIRHALRSGGYGRAVVCRRNQSTNERRGYFSPRSRRVGAHRATHQRGLIGSPHDKPAILLVVDNETKLREVLPVIRGMIAEGLVIVADAEVIPPL